TINVSSSTGPAAASGSYLPVVNLAGESGVCNVEQVADDPTRRWRQSDHRPRDASSNSRPRSATCHQENAALPPGAGPCESQAASGPAAARGPAPVTDRLIRITTSLAVAAVAVVAAVISYLHAYELVRSHGESGVTARLVLFTVDGLIWAVSMLILVA